MRITKKFHKVFLSTLIVSILLANVIIPNIARASTLNQEVMQESNVQPKTIDFGGKTNFNFIHTSDISNILYSYEENGKLYYVYENANTDLTEINTEVYEVDNESQLLVDHFTTFIDKNDAIITITKYSNDIEVDNTSIDISGERISFNGATNAPDSIKNEFSDLNGISATSGDTYNGYVYYDGSTNKYYTSWYYAYSNNGSNVITRFTYTVIIALLSTISGNPQVVAGITTAAQFILDEMIDVVYWSQDNYQVHQITYPERRYYGSFIGLRTYTTFYSDSYRMNAIGDALYEWHDPVEWPTAITIN